MTAFDGLFGAIQTRPRPEDVAQLILEILDKDLSAGERRTLDLAARNSLKRSAYAYSSMARDFARPVGAERQVKKASEIFGIPEVPSAAECLDPEVVEAFLVKLAAVIKVDPAHTDFKSDRLNRAQRKAQGMEIKKRAYNKRFRTLRRLRAKIERMLYNAKTYQATRIAKSAGATKITLEDLKKDLNTACFVAYLSARMSVRSMFTNTSQQSAFDDIASMLYKRATGRSPNWWTIALVHPEKEVLKHLSDIQKGILLGMWTETLKGLAEHLRDLHRENDYDLKNCIVHKGNDSTTWNAVAGAWNKARDHWIKLVFDLKMDHLLETYCPGKVLRLMASDVVRWQVLTKAGYGVSFDWKNQALIDKGLHPDTLVWRDLPLPWEVFQGVTMCSRATVEAVCKKHDVLSGGWSGPKADQQAVAYKPTPELVHGVVVSSPYLANVLKKAGWFSGKVVKDSHIAADVVRDEHGAAILVNPSEPIPGGSDDTLPPPPAGGESPSTDPTAGV